MDARLETNREARGMRVEESGLRMEKDEAQGGGERE